MKVNTLFESSTNLRGVLESILGISFDEKRMTDYKDKYRSSLMEWSIVVKYFSSGSRLRKVGIVVFKQEFEKFCILFENYYIVLGPTTYIQDDYTVVTSRGMLTANDKRVLKKIYDKFVNQEY
jgi:hypothetical protein